MPTDDEQQFGAGKAPDGSAVTFWEVDRPATIGARGSQGFIVEVRDSKGKRITHSDSIEGLKKAGYSLAGPAEAPVVPPAPAPAKSIEEELGA